MPNRQKVLRNLLISQGFAVVPAGTYPWTNSSVIQSGHWHAVEQVYFCKPFAGVPGGLLPKRPHWDILVDVAKSKIALPKTKKFLVVELDEEQHFNIYREQTLLNGIYTVMGRFPLSEYQAYCACHHSACLAKASWGKYWNNKGSSIQFPVFSPPGILTGGGSPRWKQRAIYDFFRDILPLVLKDLSMARVSVWDTLVPSSKLLGPVLAASAVSPSDQTLILNLIRKRIVP